MVYPMTKLMSLANRMQMMFKSHMSFCEEEMKSCLHIYLENHSDILLQEAECFNQLRVDAFVNNVHQLYMQHYSPRQKYQSSDPSYNATTVANVSLVQCFSIIMYAYRKCIFLGDETMVGRDHYRPSVS